MKTKNIKSQFITTTRKLRWSFLCIATSFACLWHGHVVGQQVLLSESFEGTVDSRIAVTTRGGFNVSPGVISTTTLGGSKAYNFGRSSCPGNCYENNITWMTITFPGGTNISQLSFKSIEVNGDFGSAGYVYTDPTSSQPTTSQNPVTAGFHTSQTPTGSNTFVVPINKRVTNIVLEVEDIANASSIYVDNILIYGATNRIVSQPQSQISCLGGSASFSVATQGSTPFSYQWYFGLNGLTGQTNAQLTLANLQTTNGGFYSIVVSNTFGSITSSTAQLTVNDSCVDIHMYAGLNISGLQGATYVLKYTTNLGLPFASWIPLATNTFSGATNWFYLDQTSYFSSYRFYGVKLLP